MQEPFIGTIIPVAWSFAARGWAACDGQLLSIAEHSILFSLLGTTYGGDGRTTFALPDLRGRLSMHAGQGPGLSSYRQGQAGGTEQAGVSVAQLPPHQHRVNCTPNVGNVSSPEGALPAAESVVAIDVWSNGTANDAMLNDMVQFEGQTRNHENGQPYLTINWLIALDGIAPTRG